MRGLSKLFRIMRERAGQVECSQNRLP